MAREAAELDVYLFPMTTGANTRSSTLPLALGTGLPVVAIRSFETDDLLVDGESLVFARSLSGSAFAEAVFRLTDDPALRQRVSLGAKRLYDEHLSWREVANKLLAAV